MDSRKRVEEMIKNYPDNLALMETLEEESRSFVPVTESEVLDMLNLPGKKEDSVQVKKQRNTERVMTIACSYRTLTRRLNADARKDISRAYLEPSREVAFIRYAIRALPRFYRELMTAYVLERESWSEVCEHFSLSGTAFLRKKEQAVLRMAKTFEQQHHYFGWEDIDNDDTRAI